MNQECECNPCNCQPEVEVKSCGCGPNCNCGENCQCGEGQSCSPSCNCGE